MLRAAVVSSKVFTLINSRIFNVCKIGVGAHENSHVLRPLWPINKDGIEMFLLFLLLVSTSHTFGPLLLIISRILLVNSSSPKRGFQIKGHFSVLRVYVAVAFVNQK